MHCAAYFLCLEFHPLQKFSFLPSLPLPELYASGEQALAAVTIGSAWAQAWQQGLEVPTSHPAAACRGSGGGIAACCCRACLWSVQRKNRMKPPNSFSFTAQIKIWAPLLADKGQLSIITVLPILCHLVINSLSMASWYFTVDYLSAAQIWLLTIVPFRSTHTNKEFTEPAGRLTDCCPLQVSMNSIIYPMQSISQPRVLV